MPTAVLVFLVEAYPCLRISMEFNPSIPPGSTRYFVHLWKQDQRQAFQPQLCQPGSVYSRIALTLGSGFTFFGLQSCCFLSTKGPNTSLRHSSFEERVGPTLLVNCSQPASIFTNVGATFASDHPHQIGPIVLHSILPDKMEDDACICL